MRERAGDLPLLINHFLKRFNRELNKQVSQIAPEATELLLKYPWPGNLRELQSVLKHAVIESTGPLILPVFLPDTLRRTAAEPGPALTKSDHAGESELIDFIHEQIQGGSQTLYDDVIRRVERTLLTELLHKVDGNISQAASILGISRSTLRIKLTAAGINLDRSVRMTE